MTSDPLKQPSIGRRLFTWDPKFTKRQEEAYTPAERRRVVPDQGQSRLDVFLKRETHSLQPPEYSYDALRDFMSSASFEHLDGSRPLDPEDVPKLVILDERKDPSAMKFTSHNWSEYTQYPPEGDPKYTETLNAKGLYDRLSDDVISSFYFAAMI